MNNLFDAMDTLTNAVQSGAMTEASLPDMELARQKLIEKIARSMIFREYVRHLERPDPKNLHPWQAEGERLYGALLMLSAGHEHGPSVMLGNDRTTDQDVIRHVNGSGATALAASVYLWDCETEDLADAAPLPRHVVSREVMPHPMMFWSRDVARGAPDTPAGENNWLFLLYHRDGIRVFADRIWQRPGGKREGYITYGVLPFGATYPDDFGDNEQQAGYLLARLAFLNSPYVAPEVGRLPRAWRREMRRDGYSEKATEPLIRVVKLRRDIRERVDQEQADRTAAHERQSHWWVSGHNRAQWYPSKEAHAVIWIAPYLKGDLSKPLAKKVYAVTR